MAKKCKFIFIIFLISVCIKVIYAQDIENEMFLFSENLTWEEDVFDIRSFDIPHIGFFYCFDNSNNILLRLSTPTAFPILFITPINVTYANSYFGINCLLLDFTFKIDISCESDPLRLFFSINKHILLRFLPLSLWGGFPISSNGMGIYLLFEIAPINIFTNKNDNYEQRHFGIGINTGLKYIFSRYIEIEIKYENYFSYNNFTIRNQYIGITFYYRLLGPDNYWIN